MNFLFWERCEWVEEIYRAFIRAWTEILIILLYTKLGLHKRGAALDVGDLVLVKQTAWKGMHKTQDRWESGEYQVVGQSTPDVPVYSVKRVGRGKTKVLHRNLLLPLQGRVR